MTGWNWNYRFWNYQCGPFNRESVAVGRSYDVKLSRLETLLIGWMRSRRRWLVELEIHSEFARVYVWKVSSIVFFIVIYKHSGSFCNIQHFLDKYTYLSTVIVGSINFQCDGSFVRREVVPYENSPDWLNEILTFLIGGIGNECVLKVICLKG